MPELPAMENFRRAIEKNSLNHKIISVTVKKDRVAQFSEDALSKRAVGQKFTSTRRHGKYVFIRIGAVKDKTWLAFHCGMTGYFTFPNADENQKTLEKAKLLVEFADGSHMAFFDPRRFGRMELIDDPDEFIVAHELGTDASDITKSQFTDILQSSGKSLKSLLLDQSFIAGIGNVYGDEIPFHARISPKRAADEMSKTEITGLFRAMTQVFKTAVAKKAYLDHWDMLPKSWLVHTREDGAQCPRCDSRIKAYKAGGRDGYYCPGCQV